MVEIFWWLHSYPGDVSPCFYQTVPRRNTYGLISTWDSPESALLYSPLTSISQVICEQCEICACNNPRQGSRLPPGIQTIGGASFEDLGVDFTELPCSRGYKHLLVFVCSYSGWVEVFPTCTEKTREVTRMLLQEIIPRFSIPVTIGSDNGPAFVAEVVQLLAKSLNNRWKLCTACRPQSSGKVERIKGTLKAQLGKLCQETHLHWDEHLPVKD